MAEATSQDTKDDRVRKSHSCVHVVGTTDRIEVQFKRQRPVSSQPKAASQSLAASKVINTVMHGRIEDQPTKNKQADQLSTYPRHTSSKGLRCKPARSINIVDILQPFSISECRHVCSARTSTVII